MVLASHLGRPDGSAAEKYSLAPVAKCLEDELKRHGTILKGCAGPSVEAVCANPSLASVILLENVRFHVEEEEKGVDKDGNKFKADAEAVKVFRSSFAKLDDAFCSDAFGTAHRAHSSMMGDGFPVECSGFLVAKELDAFAKVLDKAAKPVLAISGGAKVSDKIQLIKNTLYEATRCDVMTEEVLVPVVGAPTTGGVFDRFPQSSGMMRIVSTPLWSLRPFVCPLWLTIGKAALSEMRVKWYADDIDAYAAQEERRSSW